MIDVDKSSEPEMISRSTEMSKYFDISVTLFEETHNLGIEVFYTEKKNFRFSSDIDDSDYRFIGIKIGENTPYYFGNGEDVGEVSHTMIVDWFDDIFGVQDSQENDSQVIKAIDEVFEVIWDFLNERSMA